MSRAAANDRFLAAVASAESGRLEEALAIAVEARALDDRPPYAYLQADLLERLGRHAEALQHLDGIRLAAPDFAPARLLLGELRLAKGDVNAALGELEAARSLRPNHVPTLLALGRTLWAAGRPAEAEAAAREALAHSPRLPQALALLGHALKAQALHTRAEAAYAEAATLRDDAPLWLTLANARLDVGHIGAALEAFERAARLGPADAAQIESAHLLALHYDTSHSSATIHAAHLAWASRHANANVPRPPSRRGTRSTLRIGYVSPRLHRCSAGSMIAPVLESHSGRFEAYCYAASPIEDELTARMKAVAHGWREAWKLDDAALAAAMRADGIDIAVDLAGHTPGHRLGAFALRPAPVAVTWLDYFDTTGLAAIDALITDRWHSPPGDAQRFSESLVRLPGLRYCWQAPPGAPEPGPPPSATGAPFTFGSFNRLAKLSQATLELWCQVLDAVPRSRLVIKNGTLDHPEEHVPLRARFGALGIDPVRIECRGQSDHGEMLRQYGDIDLALDSLPYNGGIVTLESLWMGRPVLALRGDTLIARQSAAILEAAGLGDWVADDARGFVAIAARAAADVASHARACAELRPRLASSGILDAVSFTRGLEDALAALWEERAAAG